MGVPEASASQFGQDTRKCDWLHGLMLLVPAKLYWPRRWRQRARRMGQLHGYGPVRPSWLCADMNCAAARDPPECLVRTEGEQSRPRETLCRFRADSTGNMLTAASPDLPPRDVRRGFASCWETTSIARKLM